MKIAAKGSCRGNAGCFSSLPCGFKSRTPHTAKLSSLSHIRAFPCDHGSDMKILLGIVAILLLVASLVADYKWRQWIAARKRDRQ